MEQAEKYAAQVMDKSVRGERGGVVKAEAANENPCTGHGTMNDKGECECHDGYHGPTCSFKYMGEQHGYGRFVGDTRCENGVAVDNKCKCDAGWEGFHCHRRVCVHGKYGCPEDRKFCAKAECLCEEGWQGPSCDTEREACQVKECANGGVFDVDNCECKCEEPYTGELCDACMPRSCDHGMVQDPDTCACTCPKNKTCENGGILNPESCECECQGNWEGETCGKCVPQVCHNDGMFNEEECTCECMPPYDPADNCKSCPELECEHGGTFQKDKCQCKCSGHWTGDQCEECPTDEELSLQGVDCGAKGFNRETCSCNDQCPDVECQNGGVVDEDTCKCKCNPHNKNTEEYKRRDGDLFATGGAGNGNAYAESADVDDVPERAEDESEETHDSMGLDSADAEEALFLELGIDYPTFWSGERCEVCNTPEKNPCRGGRTFNTTICACNQECPADVKCEHGGELDEDTCTCSCKAPYGGKTCSQKADGSSVEMAATSCKAILDADSEAGDGKYWINPTGKSNADNAFQVFCDMTNDLGGWAQLANIGSKLREAHLDAEAYTQGIGDPTKDEEYVVACDKFNGMDGNAGEELKKVVLRVTLGEVRDYFKPISGASLCDMLTSHDKHLWSATAGYDVEGEDEDEEDEEGNAFLEEGSLGNWEEEEEMAAARFRARLRANSGGARRRLLQDNEEGDDASLTEEEEEELAKWRKPDFISDPRLDKVLGGSAKGWPNDLDGRQYLSFWGGDRGLCCHYQSTVYSDVEEADAGSWGREGQIHVIVYEGDDQPGE